MQYSVSMSFNDMMEYHQWKREQAKHELSSIVLDRVRADCGTIVRGGGHVSNKLYKGLLENSSPEELAMALLDYIKEVQDDSLDAVVGR